jgi:L-lactate dehydrogenase (cytochrome)
MASYNASLSPAQIAGARIDPEQVLFFQLYKHRDADAVARVREIEQLGFKAIFLTVDAVVPGNRERDIRAPFEIEQQECEVEEDAKTSAKTAQDMPKRPVAESIEEDDGPNEVGGTAGTLLASADLDMTWEKVGYHNYNLPSAANIFQTIPWLRGLTKLPIVLKG